MNNIVLTSKIENDNFTQYVYDNFDIQNREETTTIVPLPNRQEIHDLRMDSTWHIFLICGKSGCGKSTILKQLNNGEKVNKPIYDYNKCVISQFPKLSEESACNLLNGVGLSSVPTWLRKPQELSNGERARLDLCKAIYDAIYERGEGDNDGIVYIDEFTSVVNRDVAKSMSFALQRLVRRQFTAVKLVIASCHYDIIDWLQPDYIFNLNHMDENGDVEIEKLVYNDKDNQYQSQQTIKDCDALTEKYSI